MKKTIVISIISAFCLVFVFLFLLNKKEDKKRGISLREKRIIRKIEKDSVQIAFDFTPVYLNIKNDTLSILNYDTQKVLFLNKNNGQIQDSLGAGRGGSPLENNRMYHSDYDENFFYSFDASNYSISKTSINNDDLITYYLDTLRIYHAQRVEKDDFLITFEDDKSHIAFGKLNIESGNVEILESINKKFEKTENSWWIFDGKFDKDENDNIYYVTYFSDDLLKVDRNGNLIYKVGLVHETPLIKLKKTGDMLFPSENTYESALDTALDFKYLYVLSNVADISANENKDKRVIDAYFSEDGEYSHSYILPNAGDKNLPSEIEILNNVFYVLYEESIQTFNINF